ncbi:MAG: hypothetical protein ACUVV0_11435 [Anaerolineae bacterium]
MSKVVVSDKYADVLAALGDTQRAVEEALRRYTIEKIGERIADLRRQIQCWEEKYGCPYEVFYSRIASDEEFVNLLRQKYVTWEKDFQQWEFYVEEMREWISRLESILTD